MKPCPFCGYEDVDMIGSDLEYWVSCPQCQAAGPFGRTEITAEQRWDDRK
jgi:Lar family restriction alleviation protein